LARSLLADASEKNKKRQIGIGILEQSCSHVIYLANLGWYQLVRCNDFKSWCDAHAYEGMLHMLMRDGAHDAG
jgi:hypothetical protein